MSGNTADKPMLIVMSDMTVLLETERDHSHEVGRFLGKFADLVKSPNAVHTYKITDLSLWNAAAAGYRPEQLLEFLRRHSKYPLPAEAVKQIGQWMQRYGKLSIIAVNGKLLLHAEDSAILRQVSELPAARKLLERRIDGQSYEISHSNRGLLKQELTRMGYPVEDRAGYNRGEALTVCLKHGRGFNLRGYQQQAADAFMSGNSGSGVLILPCGAGKTIVGIAVMARLNCEVLILTPNATSVRQWKRELLEKTGLSETQIGEYAGGSRQVRPITIATYQILTHRHSKSDAFMHMRLFAERDWGLIVYDEVHLLPAPVFRVTADIQATRRLGLTATLVREDGREQDVFSLIGPKRYEVSWKELERDGWIAAADCTEIRLPMPDEVRALYTTAAKKHKQRIAGENPLKISEVQNLISRHDKEKILIIGQYLTQLDEMAKTLQAPVITGKMKYEDRETVYERFRTGQIRRLIVSKVANFAVDLPDASVAIQVSGSYGSRQEEAQRLGRILRPKADSNQAVFYTLVTRDSCEQDFAWRRQMFLVEQGYRYKIREKDDEEAMAD